MFGQPQPFVVTGFSLFLLVCLPGVCLPAFAYRTFVYRPLPTGLLPTGRCGSGAASSENLASIGPRSRSFL
jgi:hypothetical protein